MTDGLREVGTVSGMIRLLVGESIGGISENGEALRFGYGGATAGL